MGIFTRFVAKIRGTSTASNLDWDELKSELLAADLGPALAEKIIAQGKQIKGDDAQESLREILNSYLTSKSRELLRTDTTTVILVVGVNGVGKTTSVAKLANHLKESGKSVLIGAADTFRAAAVDQLCTWGDRVGVVVVTGKAESEPASVAFDAAKKAQENKTDFLIIDTAGRLHNKNDLMAELEKVKRVVEKVFPINEVLLVIDATTGQNGLQQAKIFTEAVQVSGIILTKIDGSARGGVALAIEKELDIPIKWIGTGESESDFAHFEADSYIQGLLS